MKKQVILMAAAAAVALPMVADAQILPANGASRAICTNGTWLTDAMTTDPGTSAQYLKRSFRPACSNNVDLAASETQMWLTMAAASRKGRYIMGGNTEGAAPMCLRTVATDPKCSETPADMVNPTTPATHITRLQAAVTSGAGSTGALTAFSPCFLTVPTPAGC